MLTGDNDEVKKSLPVARAELWFFDRQILYDHNAGISECLVRQVKPLNLEFQQA